MDWLMGVNLDAVLIEFIKNNLITIGFILGLLKMLARRSQSSLDDSILTYLTETIGQFRGKGRQNSGGSN